ncbi:unknown [Proteobacteria bacterium CAG:139]|nr:unknown [Proteobacteria bacterium CAG:139]
MSKTVLNVPKYKRSDGSGDIDDQNQTNRLCGRKFHDELGVNRRQRDDNSNSGLVEKPAGAKLQKFRITLEEPETVSRFLSDSFESLFKRDVFRLGTLLNIQEHRKRHHKENRRSRHCRVRHIDISREPCFLSFKNDEQTSRQTDDPA